MSIEPYTRPRIAVLLASFQGEAYIEAQLDSILAQTVPGIQIIVCLLYTSPSPRD